VRVIGRAARDDSGLICAIQGAFQDISERKRSEAEIHQLGERLQATLENITDAFVTFDRDWRVTYMNAEAERLLQRRREDLLGRGVWDELDPERQTRSFEQYHRAATTGSTVSFTEFYTPLNMWFEITAYPGPDGLAVYFRDVNAKVEQERQLRQQALLLDQATDAILVRDLDHRIRFWNRAAERLYGWRSGEVIGRSIAALLYPDDASQFEQATRQVLRGGEWTGRLQQRRRDGSAVTVEGHWTLVKDEQGRPQSILAINTDISGRLDLEERLAQAQKLESIGQLTGGVAHDFNNLLTVIIGNAELLGEAIGEGSRLTPIIDLVRTAADRGAELTSRLLAFARRQALEPKVVSPQAIVDGMAPLLRRTLGESVEVELFHEPDLWQAFIDPVQLESALLNLCINARDAMAGGGKLTIDTANVILDDAYAALHAEVVPGPYVQVAVSDTGSGIAPDDVAYVFEPFFTTKEKGKGTGLGLSMVYGFVKQSGGHIKLYSEQGHGTTVHIYLPRVQAGDRDVDEPRPPAGELHGDEHILLVEDDELVRSHAARLLGDLGYRVTIAANGPQALALLQQGLQVDLLFTDVIMPGGLNGPQLAAEAKKLAPDLPVLYTSGYTENAIVHHGRVDPGTVLLQKPYRRQALAEKIRQALAAPSAPSGTSSPERGPNNG
jgi:PAS domain S-box-containing protein